MTKITDMLLRVRAELSRRDGELRVIADQSGVHYDTVRRIRAGTHDPGYSKVQRLAVTLGLAKPITEAGQHAAGTQR